MKIETFVKKATLQKYDSAVFIAEHREFLCNFKSVLPVLALLEKRQILPTPALTQILQLIITEKDLDETFEVVNRETGEIQHKTLAQIDKSPKKVPHRYALFFFVKDGTSENCVAVLNADTFQDATRQSNNKLFRREDSVYMDILGDNITTRITRDDAVKAILGGKLGGNVSTKRTTKAGGGGLSWKPTAKQDNPKFSGG